MERETDTMSFVLNQPTTIVIQQNGKKPEVIVTGGTSPYTIAWKNAQNQIVGTGTNPTLADGAYTVCVTDRNNCTQNIEILVMNGSTGNQDTVKVTLAIDPKSNGSAISCKGSCDGRIIASASGGTAPYNYKWSHNNNLNSSIATDLCPGKTYTVTVTDNKGIQRYPQALQFRISQDYQYLLDALVVLQIMLPATDLMKQ